MRSLSKFNFIKSFAVFFLTAVICHNLSANTNQLNLVLSTEPPTLDWHKANDSTSSRVILNIMLGLTSHKLKGSEVKVVPGLAKKWSSNKDNTVWSFELIENCKWSDGKKLQAQHFADAVERLLSPNTASLYAYFLFPLKGAKEYNSGKLKDFSKVGVKAKGNTVIFSLKDPLAFFPHLMTHFSTFPIRKDVVAKHKSAWTKPENIVGLGAYNLSEWRHDRNIKLTANPNSCVGQAKTAQVNFNIVNEATTGISLFKQNAVDAFEGLPSTDIPIYKKDPSYQSQSMLSIYYFGFNVNKAPFDNPKVRKAFALAINNKTIVKVLGGGRTAIGGWLPKGVLGYTKKPYLPYNPKKAKKLLAEAGFSDPAKLGKITLAYNTNEDHKRVVEIIQAQLKRNLGVKVEVLNQEWKVYLNTIRKNPPHIYRLGWFGDYPDPDNFLNLMTSYSKNNYTGWKNKEFDKLIEQGAKTSDSKKRAEIYHQAQKLMLTEHAVAVPIMDAVNHLLVSRKLKNYPSNPMGRLILKDTQKLKK